MWCMTNIERIDTQWLETGGNSSIVQRIPFFNKDVEQPTKTTTIAFEEPYVAHIYLA